LAQKIITNIIPKKGLKLAIAPLSRENQNIGLFYHVCDQSHLPRTLDLSGQLALVFGTSSGKTSCFDFAHIRDVLAHQINVLVINHDVFIGAELAVFLTGELFLSIAEIHFFS